MAFFIGIALALAVGAFARWVGLDRDRAFYPTVMIVIASLYVLFAVMADSPAVLIAEFTVLAPARRRPAQALWLCSTSSSKRTCLGSATSVPSYTASSSESSR